MSRFLLTIAGALLLLVCNASAQAPSPEAMDAARKLVATLKIAGVDITKADLFDMTVLDEVYSENPELKSIPA